MEIVANLMLCLFKAATIAYFVSHNLGDLRDNFFTVLTILALYYILERIYEFIIGSLFH